MTDTYRALQNEQQALERSLMSPSAPSPGAEQQQTQQVRQETVQQVEAETPLLPTFLMPQSDQQAEPVQETAPAKPFDPYAEDLLADLYVDPATKALPEHVPYQRFKQVNDKWAEYREVVQEIEQQYGGLEGLREARERQAEAEREAYERQLSQTHEAKAKQTVQQLIDSGEVSETIAENLTGILTRALQAETMDKERQTHYQRQAFQQAEAKLLEKYQYAEPLAIRAALKEVGEKGAEQVARQSHNRVQTYLAKAAPPPAAVQQMQGVPVPQGRGQAAVHSPTLTAPNPGDGVEAFKKFGESEARLDAYFRNKESKKLRDGRIY